MIEWNSRINMMGGMQKNIMGKKINDFWNMIICNAFNLPVKTRPSFPFPFYIRTYMVHIYNNAYCIIPNQKRNQLKLAEHPKTIPNIKVS